jgi:hypothetical protein
MEVAGSSPAMTVSWLGVAQPSQPGKPPTVVNAFTSRPLRTADNRRMDDDGNRSDQMTNAAMEMPAQSEREEIDTDSRFFMRLLLGAGIAAGAVVGFGVVWHESELGITNPPAEQVQMPPIAPN